MEWMAEHAWAVWLGVMIVLGTAELASLDLVLLMLSVGAGAGLLTALTPAGVTIQVLVASGAAVAMIAAVRPALLARLHTGPELSLGHGKLVGRRAVVTQEISGTRTGRVEVGGETWSALPYDETLVITAGQSVEIFEIRGATAVVHPIASLES